MEGCKMIRLLLTVVILWVILALNYEKTVDFIEKYDMIDKTKKIVYNITNNIMEEVKE